MGSGGETLTVGNVEFTIVYDDKPTAPTFNARARSKRAANRWRVYSPADHLRDCLPTHEAAIQRCHDLAAEFQRNC